MGGHRDFSPRATKYLATPVGMHASLGVVISAEQRQ